MPFFTLVFDYILFYSALIILAASILLSVKTRFIQFRMLPHMVRSIISSLKGCEESAKESNTVLAHKALFAAMSTTLGISTMISPVIAIRLGGPGALIGYLLTTIFGSAATFTEVRLSLSHRKKMADGKIMGGPMQYLEAFFSRKFATFYAICCCLLVTAWSGAQANQLAAILASPLLGDYSIPVMVTGACLAISVTLILARGVTLFADVSSKLVPIMFVLYVGASFWIIFCNLDKIPELITLVFKSAFSPYEMSTGALIGGLSSAMRWGIFKGVHSNEAGLGTQTIPHSMAEADPMHQGILAMASTYSAGFIALLSGFVALITNTWQETHHAIGITMVATSFQMYFSHAGIAIVAVSAALFGIGTALGNSFNGAHCYQYLSRGKFPALYMVVSAIAIFFGALFTVDVFWAWSDILIAFVAVPHVLALVHIAYKKEALEVVAALPAVN